MRVKAVDHCQAKVFLAGEVVIERAFGHPRRLHDGVDAGVVVALRVDQLGTDAQQPLARFTGGAAGGAGCGGDGSGHEMNNRPVV